MWDVATSARIGRLSMVVVGGIGLVVAVGYPFVVGLASARGHLFWVIVAVLPSYLLAVWLSHRRPDHPQTRRLLIASTAGAVSVALEGVIRSIYGNVSHPGDWFWLFNLVHQYCHVIGMAATGVLIASYPDGTVERRWQRRVTRALWWLLAVPPALLLTRSQLLISPYLFATPMEVASPFTIDWLTWLGRPLEAVLASYLGAIVPVGVLMVRFVQAGAAQRDPMRPLVYSLAAGVLVMLTGAVLALRDVPYDSGWWLVLSIGSIPIMLAIPVSIVIGVLRYRMFDIDVVVRRSVGYGLLTVAVLLVYGLLTAVPGLTLGERVPVWLAVVVTVAAAVLFAPLRRRLDALVNRWVFGERVSRYQVLTSLGSTLENTADLGTLLPQLAATVRSGLRATWVRVSLRGADPDSWLVEPQGVAGTPDGPPVVVELLRHNDDVVGRIECGAGQVDYDPADRELLTTVAGQAATAIANVRLAAQLADQLDEVARSRARIVAAQEIERRRIERDIHDGVQQEVVALIAKLRLVRNRLDRGEPSDALLAEVQAEAGELLRDLRELAHGIHPPVLSDGGLIAAVESRAARVPLDVTVHVDDRLRGRRLDPDVESAAYYVVCEALTNVLKHARSQTAVVTLATRNGHLALSVRDDGSGLDGRGHGQGLTNLRDRVEALGGRLLISSTPGAGTDLSAELPAGGDQ